MDSPRPVPCAFSSSFSKRVNTDSRLSAAIPHPVSVTAKRAMSSFVSSDSVMEPSVVNLFAFTRRLMSSCCSRASSVTIGSVSSCDSKMMAALVCFTLSTVFTTLWQVSTASCSSSLNCISPSCCMEKSTTSCISFISKSEFCCMMDSNCFLLSSSRLSSARKAVNPARALSGVRISWLMFERKMFFSLTEFSTICRAWLSFSFDSISRRLYFLSIISPATSSPMTSSPPITIYVISMFRCRLLRRVCCATRLAARSLFTLAI